MVDRTWIGGGNNKAGNAKDWSPTGIPQPGDNLTIASGTMNIAGSDIPSSDYLMVQGTATLNLSDDAFVDTEVYAGDPTINIHGIDTLVVGSNYMASTTVDLASHSIWVGSYQVGFNTASFTVNGPSTATFINTAEPSLTYSGSSYGAGVQAINVAVAGAGSFTVDTFGKLTFTKAVGASQTVILGAADINDGGATSPPVLNLDDPKHFAATVNLEDGIINLAGLAKADSYTFKNDMLSIYAGKSIIDVLQLHDNTAYGFSVVKTATGVSVDGNIYRGVRLDILYGSSLHPQGTMLPVHTQGDMMSHCV